MVRPRPAVGAGARAALRAEPEWPRLSSGRRCPRTCSFFAPPHVLRAPCGRRASVARAQKWPADAPPPLSWRAEKEAATAARGLARGADCVPVRRDGRNTKRTSRAPVVAEGTSASREPAGALPEEEVRRMPRGWCVPQSDTPPDTHHARTHTHTQNLQCRAVAHAVRWRACIAGPGAGAGSSRPPIDSAGSGSATRGQRGPRRTAASNRMAEGRWLAGACVMRFAIITSSARGRGKKTGRGEEGAPLN